MKTFYLKEDSKNYYSSLKYEDHIKSPPHNWNVKKVNKITNPLKYTPEAIKGERGSNP